MAQNGQQAPTGAVDPIRERGFIRPQEPDNQLLSMLSVLYI